VKSKTLGQGYWWFGVFAVVGVLLVGAYNAVAVPPDPSTETTLSALDQDAVRVGRQVYLTNCAACHGPNAEGAPGWQRPDDKGNIPPPSHDDSGHTWRHSDQQLKEIILNGWRDPFNKTPELTMPPFRGKLNNADAEAVITYFKSLWSDEHRRYQREAPVMP